MHIFIKNILIYFLVIALLFNSQGIAEAFFSEDANISDIQREEKSEKKERTVSDECSILKYVHETEFEKGNHVIRLEEAEELYSYVFQNEDGTRTAYFLDENVKYVDEDGTIVEKDITLVEKEDEFVTARNDVGLSIPKEISSGIKLSYDEKNVVLWPLIEESIEGVKEEETVVYKDAFGDNTELRYTPTLCGVKEDIVLSEYVPDTEYKFLIVADGKKLFSDEKGLYFSEDENKIEKIRLGDVIVFDNSGRFSEGELKVEENEDGSYLLTIIPDEEFLADPETVYPVIIDPSLTVSDNTHGANAGCSCFFRKTKSEFW